jgi:ELWxxDGT repeat protein
MIVRRVSAVAAALAAVAGALFLAAHTHAAPPRMLADLNPTPGEGSQPGAFARPGKRVLFGAATSGIDVELWRTDGTARGTKLLKRIQPGPEGSNPHGFTRLGKRTLFAADDGEHGIELWRTDGTARGTKLVRDIYPGVENGVYDPIRFARLGRHLYFVGRRANTGLELWRTDGTKRGTRLVRDIAPGPADGVPGFAFNPVRLGGRLLFAAFTGPGGTFQFWRTDGRKRGTRRVAPTKAGYEPAPVRLGRHVYFTGADSRGYELWRTNGTKRGTKRVKDIAPGSADGDPRSIVKLGKVLLFDADDGTHGRELWRSRGTAKSTRLVRDVVPGPDPFNPGRLVVFGKQAFFQGNDGTTGEEPWVSDGTAKGTRLLRDINPTGSSMIYFSAPTRFGKRVVFSATDAADNYELWVTNGKPNGTRKFEVNPTAGSFPYAFKPVGRALYFGANDGTNGTEPWIWRP